MNEGELWVEGVLLEKVIRMERLNDISVRLLWGEVNMLTPLNKYEQIKYLNIGEFHYLMDLTNRSKVYKRGVNDGT
jgi:hypothetical protein|tara:strand:+ start:271 stop:498 length:228 start_codon:yes stop_codon:yes gene_type:complete